MTMVPHAQNQAIALLQNGRPDEAERLCRQMLASAPAALHLIGLVRLREGRDSEAAELIGASLQLHAADSGALVNYGLALRGLGRLEEALAILTLSILSSTRSGVSVRSLPRSQSIS